MLKMDVYGLDPIIRPSRSSVGSGPFLPGPIPPRNIPPTVPPEHLPLHFTRCMDIPLSTATIRRSTIQSDTVNVYKTDRGRSVTVGRTG